MPRAPMSRLFESGAANLGDLVTPTIYASIAALEAAYPASEQTETAFAFVGGGTGDTPAIAYIDSATWVGLTHIPLGDFTDVLDGRVPGDWGLDANGVIYRWVARPDGAGEWVHAAPFGGGFVTLSALDAVVQEDPGAAGWTETEQTGASVDFDDTVPGKIAALSGESVGLVGAAASPQARATAAIVGFVIRAAKVTGGVGAGPSALVTVHWSDGTDFCSGLESNDGDWVIVSTTPGSPAAGVSSDSEHTFEFWLDTATGDWELYVDREPTPSETGTITVFVASTVDALALAAAIYIGAQSTLEFERFVAFRVDP